MASSNGNIFRVRFSSQRPVTLSFDVFLPAPEQTAEQTIDTPSRSLWRHYNKSGLDGALVCTPFLHYWLALCHRWIFLQIASNADHWCQLEQAGGRTNNWIVGDFGRHRCNKFFIYIIKYLLWSACPCLVCGAWWWYFKRTRMTKLRVSRLNIIGSDNGLSPGRWWNIVKDPWEQTSVKS